jgi:hypothetical protein
MTPELGPWGSSSVTYSGMSFKTKQNKQTNKLLVLEFDSEPVINIFCEEPDSK